MTIDEAIAHALEVAEKNECKMTSDDGYTDVSMKRCAAEHRQLAEWLMELKDLREEYAYISKVSYGYYKELKEAKRLLKMAVEDMQWVNENTQDADGTCIMRKCEGCGDCPLDINGDLWCKWKHEDEALNLIGEPNDEP